MDVKAAFGLTILKFIRTHCSAGWHQHTVMIYMVRTTIGCPPFSFPKCPLLPPNTIKSYWVMSFLPKEDGKHYREVFLLQTVGAIIDPAASSAMQNPSDWYSLIPPFSGVVALDLRQIKVEGSKSGCHTLEAWHHRHKNWSCKQKANRPQASPKCSQSRWHHPFLPPFTYIILQWRCRVCFWVEE